MRRYDAPKIEQPPAAADEGPKASTMLNCRRHAFRLVPDHELPSGAVGPWMQCRRCHQWARP